ESHADGLIAINGHLGSELAFHLFEYAKTGDESFYARARDVARWHMKVFKPGDKGPRFYIELQHHIPEQNAVNPHLIRLAHELKLPLIATHDAHDTLICISTGKLKSDTDRMKYPDALYVKSPSEMRDIFEREYAEGDIG